MEEKPCSTLMTPKNQKFWLLLYQTLPGENPTPGPNSRINTRLVLNTYLLSLDPRNFQNLGFTFRYTAIHH